MRPMLRSVSVIVVVSLLTAGLGPAQPCQGQVRINEILADPASDWNGDGAVNFKSDEWVEIVNVGAAAVAIDSLRLSDASGTFRFGFSGTLPAGGHVRVLGSESVAWESAVGASTVGLSLNNGGDTVQLWQLNGADTLLVDAYTYQSHEVLDDRSAGRLPDGGPVWVLFDALNPYSGADPPQGSGCHPTPGFANDCPTPVQPRTWSAVKRSFRGREAGPSVTP